MTHFSDSFGPSLEEKKIRFLSRFFFLFLLNRIQTALLFSLRYVKVGVSGADYTHYYDYLSVNASRVSMEHASFVVHLAPTQSATQGCRNVKNSPNVDKETKQ